MNTTGGEDVVAVLLTERAAESIDEIACLVYERQGTEWGGVTFGRVWAAETGLIVVIEDATAGVCGNATPTRCDILPASWRAGEEALVALGRRPGMRIGTWHSHPRMPALPSQHMDVPSFWGYSNVPHFVGLIANPYDRAGPDHSCWVLDRGAGHHRRAPSYVVADTRVTRAWFQKEGRND